MQGTLSQVSLAEIFTSIYHDRKSGELIVARQGVEKHIFFERGQVVFATSNLPGDRIGETLVRYKKLTREQMESFVAQLVPGQRVGRALADAGLIDERELVSYVTLQIVDIVYSLFNWADGAYHFIEGEGRAPEELKLKFSTATLIVEGIRRIEDMETVRRGLGLPALMLAPTAAGRSKMQAVAFSPLELTIMNMVKEPIDLFKIVMACKERPEKVLQAIYALMAIGLLEKAEAWPTAGEPATAAQPAAAAADSALLAEIENLKQRIATRDPRIVLGLTTEKNANEVYDTYLRLATRFHPDQHVGVAASLRVDIDYIFNAINESYNFIRSQPAMPPQIAAPPPAPPMYNPPNPYGAPPGNPNMRMRQTGANQAYSGDSYQQPGYGAPPQYPPQQNYYGMPQGPLPNPMAPYQTGGVKRSSITRAVSDEVDFTSGQRDQGLPARKGSADVERAMSEMLDYFDDRRAPLFAADALTTLLRTKPPLLVGQREVVETIITWARNKASVMGWPLAVVLLRVVSLIKQAEQAQLIEDFDGAKFYPTFVQELAGYCTPPEAEEFMRGIGTI